MWHNQDPSPRQAPTRPAAAVQTTALQNQPQSLWRLRLHPTKSAISICPYQDFRRQSRRIKLDRPTNRLFQSLQRRRCNLRLGRLLQISPSMSNRRRSPSRLHRLLPLCLRHQRPQRSISTDEVPRLPAVLGSWPVGVYHARRHHRGLPGQSRRHSMRMSRSSLVARSISHVNQKMAVRLLRVAGNRLLVDQLFAALLP